MDEKAGVGWELEFGVGVGEWKVDFSWRNELELESGWGDFS